MIQVNEQIMTANELREGDVYRILEPDFLKGEELWMVLSVTVARMATARLCHVNLLTGKLYTFYLHELNKVMVLR